MKAFNKIILIFFIMNTFFVFAKDTTSVQLKNLWNTKYETKSLDIDSNEKSISFSFRYNAIDYVLTFDCDKKNELIEACKQYLSEFENKNLKKDNKKNSQYLNITSVIDWNVGKEKAGSCNSDLVIGYVFDGKNPYFIFLIAGGENSLYSKDSSKIKELQRFALYFTRTQVESLCKILEKI